eukprot:TRINITY_DN4930_c0_g2_i2.p1 TRINITY_DN4930_c0_g2~~TRINITY_DN4930_c0_g2_i2.p1  ORF type:complete len:363 (+),score=61.01 TRINITY_DN4930_c0_g2_i2:77-1090(+)
MSAGRCGCCGRALVKPSQWLGVEDVFTTVASYLPTFDLAQLAASGSRVCVAVRMVVEQHWNAGLELDAQSSDLMQVMEEFLKALATTAETAEGLLHAEETLATLQFRHAVARYAAAGSEIFNSICDEYLRPWNLHWKKLGCWVYTMHKIERDWLHRHLRDAESRLARNQQRLRAITSAPPGAGRLRRAGTATPHRRRPEAEGSRPPQRRPPKQMIEQGRRSVSPGEGAAPPRPRGRRGQSAPRGPHPGGAASPSRRRGATPAPRVPPAGGPTPVVYSRPRAAQHRPSAAAAGAGGRGRSRASAGGRGAPAAPAAAAAGAAAGEQRRQVQAVKPAAAW